MSSSLGQIRKLCGIPIDSYDIKIFDCVTVIGGWNWDIFKNILPKNSLNKIVVMKPPSKPKKEEIIRWT